MHILRTPINKNGSDSWGLKLTRQHTNNIWTNEDQHWLHSPLVEILHPKVIILNVCPTALEKYQPTEM